MLVFLDTEFTDFIRPDLISIALVSEDGREFYAERTDYFPTRCSEFVRETVLPLLGRVPGASCTHVELTNRLREWFKQLPEPATIVYDHNVDWHLLAVAMLGWPHSKPPGDFAKQLFLDSNTVTHPVFEMAKISSYTEDWPLHHALADARALMAGYNSMNIRLPQNLLAALKAIVENSTSPDAKGFDSEKWLVQWLERPQPALGGRKPAELIDTPTGIEVVIKLLGAIESGAFQ